MAPTIQNIHLESDRDEFFLLCTLKLPIAKNSDAFSMIRMGGSNCLETDFVKAEVCKMLSSEGLKGSEYSQSIKTISSAITTDVKQGIHPTTLSPVHISANTDSKLYDNEETVLAQAVSMGMAVEKGPFVSKKELQSNVSVPNSTQDQCLSIKQEQTYCNKGPSVTREMYSSPILANNYAPASERQMCTWNLNKQNAMNYLYKPVVSEPALGKASEACMKVSGTETSLSFIDLTESFGIKEMRTPINESGALTLKSDRSLYRNYSTGSSSSTPDMDCHLDDLVKDFDNYNNMEDVSQLSSGMAGTQSPQSDEDIMNFQALMSVLSSPVEECSTEDFTRILEEEMRSKQHCSDMIINNITERENFAPRQEVFSEFQKAKKPFRNEVIQPDQDIDRLKKKPGPRKRPNQCYHLWDFLKDELSGGKDYVEWVSKESQEFRILDTKKIADAWGHKKRSHSMNYDKLSRSLRYYCKLSILEKVKGKRLHFRFGKGKMWTKV